jgi:hypothetical protein
MSAFAPRLPALALAAALGLSGCVAGEGGPLVVTRPYGPAPQAYGYGTPQAYGYGAPPAYGYGAPRDYAYGYGSSRSWGPPVYSRPQPRGYAPYPDRYYGRSGGYDPFYRPGARRGGYGNPYRDNGRCDDARYESSNGGRARPGTDEFDCSRYGNGLKGRYR